MPPTIIVLSASILLALAAIFSSIACAITILVQTRMKIAAEAKMREEMFSFDKRLAYTKVRLERVAGSWRRRADFAELTLMNFFEFEAIVDEVREKPRDARRSFSDYRMAKAAIGRKQEFISRLRTQKNLAYALFGDEGGKLYEEVLSIVLEIEQASQHLSEAVFLDCALEGNKLSEYEAVIWSRTIEAGDPIKAKMKKILIRAEEVFSPTLQPPFNDTAPL